MSRETLARKFLANVVPVLGVDRAGELLERFGGLEREGDVRHLTSLFAPPPARL